MSSASFYKWRSKYGGLDARFMARMKELDEGDEPLKAHWFELNGERASRRCLPRRACTTIY